MSIDWEGVQVSKRKSCIKQKRLIGKSIELNHKFIQDKKVKYHKLICIRCGYIKFTK